MDINLVLEIIIRIWNWLRIGLARGPLAVLNAATSQNAGYSNQRSSEGRVTWGFPGSSSYISSNYGYC